MLNTFTLNEQMCNVYQIITINQVISVTSIACDKHYVDTVGILLEINTEEDLTTATNTKIYLLKPDGTELILPATVYNRTYLRYITVDGDLDQIGFYRVQAGFTKGNWTGRGCAAKFVIYPKFA